MFNKPTQLHPDEAVLTRSEPDVVEMLHRRKTTLEAELQDINNALDALKANPEVAKVLTLVSKVSRRY